MLQYEFEIDQGYSTEENQAVVEANKNSDLERYGNWDGRLNEPPQEEHWGELAYRKGYVTGITQYYDQKYHISIEEF